VVNTKLVIDKYFIMDQSTNSTILTINAGSSSIKLALFKAAEKPQQFYEISISNIGLNDAEIKIVSANIADNSTESIEALNSMTAVAKLIDKIKTKITDPEIMVIAHRIVHGGPDYYKPSLITPELVTTLKKITFFDPVHLPLEIEIIEMFQKMFPNTPQVACFDTALHHDLPDVAKQFAIPRKYQARGLRRYGFHGLSCTYIIERLADLEGSESMNSKVIIAHLGSGVSLTAVNNGKSIDTTMGMTPASGVVMSSRSGDLDPGLGLYLFKHEGIDPIKFNDLINFKSGLLGISGTSSDMKKLLQIESTDENAKQAIDLFCYSIKKAIGSLSAALGGLNTLVFTGGMGENASEIRSKICDGLEYLGIIIDNQKNSTNNGIISRGPSLVTVRVIHTDESSIIANQARELIKSTKGLNAIN
jgi:acetate kinase